MTSSQIQATILNGQVVLANLMEKNRLQLAVGNYFVKWDLPRQFNRTITALTYCYNYGDYTSITCTFLYDCLNQLIGIPPNATIDPNFQNSGITINVNNSVVGTNIVYGKIPFTTTGPFVLSNYNNTLKQVYGNNLITYQAVQTGAGYTEDFGTPGTIAYLTPNDPTTDITSITFDYPAGVIVSGYINIAGVMPVTGTSGSGSGGAVPFTYNQSNLLQDGNGSWYLPLALPTNKNPIFTTVNGVSIATTYDTSFNPARLYGFANNSTQSIVVSVI